MKPMKLWRKAAAAVKDKRSIYLAKVGRKKGFRNPNLEAAIIKATSHNSSSVDYKNAQRVFNWVRTSPNSLKPFMWALTKRVEKTRNWVVALKALMLIHGVFCTKIPTVLKIGRLPFNLSTFQDTSTSPAKSLGYSAFVRAYFAFLDQQSSFLSSYHDEDEGGGGEQENQKQGENDPSMRRMLQRLHLSQAQLDLLLQIKPLMDRMKVGLVLEALDNIILEIFDIYTGICSDVTDVLSETFFRAGPSDASDVLLILRKGALQTPQLKAYLELCRGMGVLNAGELPAMEHVTEEDISDLERIAKGGSSGHDHDEYGRTDHNGIKRDSKEMTAVGTTVTENWVMFEDDDKSRYSCLGGSSSVENTCEGMNGFWQLHHQTKMSLWPDSNFNKSRMSVVC